MYAAASGMCNPPSAPRGKRHYTDTYRFVSHVPLRDGNDALQVNWCELTTTRHDGKVVYQNAFATNHAITPANVAEVVRAGRARWKVENENNNTLKTKGYHLTHNAAGSTPRATRTSSPSVAMSARPISSPPSGRVPGSRRAASTR